MAKLVLVCPEKNESRASPACGSPTLVSGS